MAFPNIVSSSRTKCRKIYPWILFPIWMFCNCAHAGRMLTRVTESGRIVSKESNLRNKSTAFNHSLFDAYPAIIAFHETKSLDFILWNKHSASSIFPSLK
ncbi:hypothetical protein TorRG33x02_335920 [Trema orientale]|uniref:Uncharacterized protein n=1 Tax=Trema orientale TaxID=63057 RepID=A0A2P5B0S7_TREOI|nr:hypothetical protein TorRG33x02_335920 [Trema orientale]